MDKATTQTMIMADPQSALLSAYTADQRKELRRRLRAGDLDELTFDAVVFKTGPNRNHVRFRDEEMEAFAASFIGQPFLRDHNTHSLDARDGTILDSRMDGDKMVQTVRLTTERGMRDFLDNLIDRFSIGWFYESVECGICHQDWLRCDHWPGRRYPDANNPDRNILCEIIFINPQGKETSAVNTPAVDGTHVLNQLTTLKESHNMAKPNEILLPDGSTKTVQPAAAAAPQPSQAEQADIAASALLVEVNRMKAELEERQRDELIAASGLSQPSQDVVRMATRGRPLDETRAMIEQQRNAEAAAAQRHLVTGVGPVAANMTTAQDRIQSSLNWIFGAHDEPTPPPSMRSIRDLYQAVTGDVNWYGKFDPDYSQLAAASTATLSGMVVNALNKVIQMHFDNMATYRWYEPIVSVQPHDGSTHDIQLIMVDGLANLPTVAEGAAYTEASVGDSKESMAFTKRGHYVGITLEAIRKSDIARLQAIPREMVKASIRTRSAAIAGIFTQNAGVGPTLADDSKALFHVDHDNLDTAALDATGWSAARKRIWSQTVPGTGSPLGLWPTFCLVPIDLYDSALILFGYGSGDVGKPNSAGTAQEPNPYGNARTGDPRPIPIPVPEWSDTNDWAYIVDPRLHPVIHMAYANAPQGGSHPMPEIYEVAGETNGLMFTNDTLPVKVRDWWTYGVGTYVGVGKNNVT